MMAQKLTTAQAAAEFGVTRRTIQKWADDGILPCTRTLGGDRRFDADVVEQMKNEAR